MPLGIRVDVYHHILDGSAVLKPILEEIVSNQQQLAEQLSGVRDKLSEAATEIVAKIQELTEALGVVSPEVQQLADDLTAQANGLADIVPNEPAED